MNNLYDSGIGQVLAIILTISQCLHGGSSVGVLSEQAIDAIPDVVDRMQSKDPKVRSDLIDELLVLEEDDHIHISQRYTLTDSDYSIILQNALSGLARELSDHDQDRVLNRVRVICRVHDLTGIDRAISEFAEGSSVAVSNTAVRILVDLKSPLATPHLISELSNPRKYYRAIQDLVAVKGAAAVPRLAELLPTSKGNTQYWIVWALFNLNANQCADQIYISCVKNQHWRDINSFVLAVLVKWEDARVYPIVMNQLTDSDGVVRDKMMNRLVDVGATPIEDTVIAFLESGHVNAPDRGTERNIMADAIRLLGMLKSDEAIPLLRKTVAEKDDYLGCVAARQLGLMEAKEAIPELLSMLDTRRYSDYVASTFALAQIGDPSTVERILSELKKKQSNAHHVEVLETLARVSAPKTYQMLRDTKLPEVFSHPADKYFAHVADVTKVSVRLSENVLQKDRDRIVAGRKEHTGLSALRRGMSMLNYNGYYYALFVEEDIVHIVPIEEAYSKWDDWLQEHSLK